MRGANDSNQIKQWAHLMTAAAMRVKGFYDADGQYWVRCMLNI